MQYGEDVGVSPLGAFFRNKWVITILVLDVLAIIIVAILNFINNNKTVNIKFDVAPVDATILVNGKGYTNGEFVMEPGAYEIQVKRDGLNSKSLTMELGAQDNVTIATFLSNGKDFDFYKLKENYESFKKLSEIASAENNQTFDNDESAEEFIESFGRIISIGEILPINYELLNEEDISVSPYFSIDIDDNCRYYNLCLLASPILNATHDDVLEFIRQNGYNPDDYDVTFKDRIEL